MKICATGEAVIFTLLALVCALEWVATGSCLAALSSLAAVLTSVVRIPRGRLSGPGVTRGQRAAVPMRGPTGRPVDGGPVTLSFASRNRSTVVG
jgi:hypothetical protein